MRTRIMMAGSILVLGVGLGWYVAAQTVSPLPTFAPGQVLTAAALNAVVEQVSANTTALTGAANAAPLQVNCNAGDSLGQALQLAQPGRTIQVSGTCTERVTITTDRLTLDGQGTAVLDGGDAEAPVAEIIGVVTIVGARGVTITGFTVQNGHDGIVGTGGAAFAVRNTTLQDNTQSGLILVENSTVEITDCTARRNGRFGIGITRNSSALFRGTIRSTENGTFGIFITHSSAAFQGATVEANNNGVAGLTGADSTTITIGGLLIGGLSGVAPSSLTTNGNRVHGILLFSEMTLRVTDASTITATNNGNGFFLIGNAVVAHSPPPGTVGARFVIENNTTGVNLDLQSGFFVIGGVTVRNNTTGLLANGANTVTVVSTPQNPSSITGNGTDVDLRFGVRSTFAGVTIGSITCDDTVLSRGTTVCPTAP